jgi:hypothetical protein
MRNGRMVLIDDDVANVVRDLQEIDPGLRVRFSMEEGVFVVYHRRLEVDGEREKLVTTAHELDQRIVRRVREISRPGYDFVAELDRLDREAECRKDREFSEKIGPHAERLAWALRQDLGRNERAVIPADVPKG